MAIFETRITHSKLTFSPFTSESMMFWVDSYPPPAGQAPARHARNPTVPASPVRVIMRDGVYLDPTPPPVRRKD
jgi:hypothetical protein